MDFNLLSSNVLLEKDSKSVCTYHRDEYLPRWLDRGERFPTRDTLSILELAHMFQSN